MKKILVIGAGKSSTSLIEYLITQARSQDWQLTIADGNPELAKSKIPGGTGDRAKAVSLSIEDQQARDLLIDDADLVISLLPPGLHYLAAGSCLVKGKHLLTASYLDDRLKVLEPSIRERGLLFLCEMGLDPGIDHMSAMELIRRIQQQGKKIRSFRSHTGGLVSPESDDNPWHYKISWNPHNVVMAGSAGARFKEDGRIIDRPYQTLFEDAAEIDFPGIGPLAWYPNRDSLSYIPLYGLETTDTFIRTTLRYPIYCKAWRAIVKAGLTMDQHPVLDHAEQLNLDWAAPLRPFVDPINKPLFDYLGLFDKTPLPPGATTSADILQKILEQKLAMKPGDKDMIVMMHEIDYESPSKRGEEPERHRVISSLLVKGRDALHTAMAQTVGLPLGIAARLILEGKLRLTGLHIPILPEIYEPVLRDLAALGIQFEERQDQRPQSTSMGRVPRI